MATGFIAVFAAIFYKINSSDSDAGNAIIPESIAVGPDVIVEDIELVEGRLLMLIREGEAAALLHIDPSTGEQLGRTNLTSR